MNSSQLRLLIPSTIIGVLVGSPTASSGSQGPGVALGTASQLVQHAMAGLVYGSVAVFVAVALFMAVRKK